jgi:DNA-directed RNA polymerase subunit M/transcription elongation factor TFIIS
MTLIRIAKTPCQKCGNHLWEPTKNTEDQPVYECPNCGEQRARKVQTRKTTVTASQTAAVESLIRRALNRCGAEYAQNYEVKGEVKQEMTAHGTLVVFFTVGRKNDEGTMAEFYCRETYHIFVGRTGGLRAYDSKKGKFVTGYHAAFRTLS